MTGLVRPAALPRALAREPWSEVARLHQDMDDFVARVLGFTPLSRMVEGPAVAALPLELYETAEGYLLRAHLAGVSREDVNLEIEGQKITLWGERRAQAPEGAQALISTAAFGRFRFEYELPVEVRADEVKATYRDGILEVSLPKVEAARPQARKVAIEG